MITSAIIELDSRLKRKMENKNIGMLIKKVIHNILGKFDLQIRRNNPREFILFAKEYFKEKEVMGAEVGVQFGVNAKYMFKELNIKKLYAIDSYEGYNDFFDGEVIHHDFSHSELIAKQNLEEYNDRVRWLRMDSENALNILPDNLDFVYIDANHSYKYIKKDIEDYWKKIKKGGLLAGHDLPIYSVARAVVEFANENSLEVISKFKDGEWIIIKKEDGKEKEKD